MTRIIGIIVIICATFRASGQTITIPYDTNKVTIDGIIGQAEWQYHTPVTIPVGADSVSVWCKHDLTNLYFAYMGNLEAGANMKFPEMLVDPLNIKSNTWQAGQWWFHVSATDCEQNGAYGIYNNCAATQPDWEGAPNFAPGLPETDTVEIRIPFGKIGFNATTDDTIGLSLLVSNTFNLWSLWPQTADTGRPGTWANAIISKSPANIQTVAGKGFAGIFPNPATDLLTVTGIQGDAHVTISDLQGRLLITQWVKSGEAAIDVSKLTSGIYLVEISGNDVHSVHRFHITR